VSVLANSKTTLTCMFLLMWVVGCATTADPYIDKRLTFVGTVKSINSSGDALRPWIVTIAVENVLVGTYSGTTLQFPVHSPAMSGLEIGHAYTVEASQNGATYMVDESQWRK
jgi:hypothetical protein